VANLRPDRGSTTGTRRWVYILGIIVLILILMVVVVMLVGGGEGDHGPSRHGAFGGGTGGQASSVSVTAHGML
jgi:hypothetical protein